MIISLSKSKIFITCATVEKGSIRIKKKDEFLPNMIMLRGLRVKRSEFRSSDHLCFCAALEDKAPIYLDTALVCLFLKLFCHTLLCEQRPGLLLDMFV